MPHAQPPPTFYSEPRPVTPRPAGTGSSQAEVGRLALGAAVRLLGGRQRTADGMVQLLRAQRHEGGLFEVQLLPGLALHGLLSFSRPARGVGSATSSATGMPRSPAPRATPA